MATSVKARRSKDANCRRSEKYKCDVCFKLGVRTEASHYCPSCDMCYCKSCLCGHDVKGRDSIQHWGSLEKSKTKDMCAWHPEEALLLLCKEHDELCCRLCFSEEHRFCKDMQDLQSIKDEAATQRDKKILLKMLEELKKKADVFIKDTTFRCETVETSYNACLKRLGEFREKVNSKFDEIEQELSTHKTNYLDRYKGDLKVCKDALTAHEKYQQRFSDTTQQYSAYELKKCKTWVNYTDNYFEMGTIIIKDNFVPIALTDIESTIETIKTLGTINTDHVQLWKEDLYMDMPNPSRNVSDA